ncbi:MAG TPA: phosphatase PAP2 family protein [Candidatus Limnocylindrales bacterium]
MSRVVAAGNQGMHEPGQAVGRMQVKAPCARDLPSDTARRRRAMTRVVVAGLGGFGALTALIGTSDLEAIDDGITARLQAVRGPAVERAMSFVSWFGFPPQGRVLPPAYAAALWLRRYRLEAVFQLVAWGAAPLGSLIKSSVGRPRPAAGKDVRVVAAPLDGSSFPSGHVLTYVGVYGWMAYMAHRLIVPALPRRLAVAALTTLVAAVGPSRVYLGHHRPSDVAASYLLGSSCLAAMIVVYRRLRPQGASR